MGTWDNRQKLYYNSIKSDNLVKNRSRSENMFKKKENIVIIVLLVVMILAVIGVSYAAFNYSKTGTKLNSITTGSITMTYTETDNTITLNGALPVNFKFIISNNFKNKITYKVSNKKVYI